MTFLDLFIVAAYLAGVIAAGAWFSKRQKTTAQYFLGGRSVPWWAISASIVATETSTITFISVPGIAYARGGNFTFLQLAFGYVLGRVVISILFLPSYFSGELLTVYQLLTKRFGGVVKGLAASLFVTMRTIGDGIRLLLTALVLAAVAAAFAPTAAPETVVFVSVVALGLVMVVFTLWGGMEAVIWIEVVQLGIYVGGAVAAAIVLTGLIPGGLAGALDVAERFGKVTLFDTSLAGHGSYTTLWAGLIGGAFLTMSTHGTDQYLVQRYLCTDRPSRAAAALLVSGVVVLVQFAGFLTIGLLLFAFYKPYELASYASGSPAAPFNRVDAVFPDFITHHLPHGLAGLVVAAILAAAMSSSLNSIAATAVNDLYRPLVPNREDGHYLALGKRLTALAGAAQILVALLVRRSPTSALDKALAVASLLNGPVLGVFLIGAFTKRAGRRAALAGMGAGIVVAFSVWRFTPVAWPWYAAIGSLTTLAVGSVVGLFEPDAHGAAPEAA
ncbi:MAG TPA: sodium/solute symporter [Thermoanaerobaculia bacterium]|nr:sodium/solute symporter [Thermoanaerobaculia bacterium]